MTNTDLIKLLEQMPANTPVLLAIDAEGNSYRTLDEAAVYTGDEAEEFIEEANLPDDTLSTIIVLWPS